MPYKPFYNLKTEPFANTPAQRLYFPSQEHERVLTRLRFAVEGAKGLSVCVGAPGTGKTTVSRRLLDSLGEDSYQAAMLVIIHSGVDTAWLLRRIALQLGIKNPPADKMGLVSQLYRQLIRIYEEGRRAVVLIDEAQLLRSREIMEELRGLLNLEATGRKLLNVVLFGLPDLDEALKLDEALRQRVAVHCALKALPSDASGGYVLHRLKLAGAPRPILSSEALKLVCEVSGGVPRIINTLCDNLLFEGAVAKKESIDSAFVRAVAEELGLIRETPEPAAAAEPQSLPETSASSRQDPATPENAASPHDDLADIDRLLAQLDRY